MPGLRGFTVPPPGLIIDAFGELRDQLESVKENLESNCFICGMGVDYFDAVPHGFDMHTQKEHNLANYMYVLPTSPATPFLVILPTSPTTPFLVLLFYGIFVLFIMTTECTLTVLTISQTFRQRG